MAFLIAIEGIDGSGKGTQASRLLKQLQSEGRTAALLSFPRYNETRFGRAIGAFLNGHFGNLEQVHPQLASLLFAGDRFESRGILEKLLRDHEVVICDRYVASNVAHQAAKLDGPAQAELTGWIEQIEYEVYALPRPDLTLLMDLPVVTAQELITKKATRVYTSRDADLHEADAEYLQRVRELYRSMARAHSSWIEIAVGSDGSPRPPEDVGQEILEIVHQRLSPSSLRSSH